MKIINKVNPPENAFSGLEVGETFVRRDRLNTIYMRTPTVGTMYNAIELGTGYFVWICSGTPVIRVKATLIVSNEDEPDPP
jgi:hypothetical protein